jgi:hypothetical protein
LSCIVTLPISSPRTSVPHGLVLAHSCLARAGEHARHIAESARTVYRVSMHSALPKVLRVTIVCDAVGVLLRTTLYTLGVGLWNWYVHRAHVGGAPKDYSSHATMTQCPTASSQYIISYHRNPSMPLFNVRYQSSAYKSATPSLQHQHSCYFILLCYLVRAFCRCSLRTVA